MPSISDETQASAKSLSSFRQSVGSISKKNKWVSPFRQQQSTESSDATQSEKHVKSESNDSAVPATKKQKVDEDKSSVDRTINPKDLEKRLGDLSKTAETSTNKKIKPEDRMVDLGGGLKMSQAAIDKIARERLGKDLDKINEKASAQQKLKELKHQKKLELQALKDQNKVNSKFAKFKKKLDLEKKNIQSEHEKKVQEIEATIASLDKEIKDFDKKTKAEVEQAAKDAEIEKQNADKKLVEDKEKTSKEAADLEKEHLQSIHDHQINQKKTEIASRVLHAKQSQYELELELLELKLAQSNRELTKQKEQNSSHFAIKEDLEAKIATTKQAIAENTAKIEKSETTQLESAKSLKSAEGELESSKETVESLRAQLAELKADKIARDQRLQKAIAEKKIHDEEQEKLRKEAEEKTRLAEEERRREKEEEEKRQAEKAEKLRLEEEQRKRQEAEQKRLDEEERQRKLAQEEKARKEKEEKLRLEAQEKQRQNELAVASFDDDITSRKQGLDKEIEAKKSSNAGADELALLELERKHLNGWTFENKDSKAKELDSLIASTKEDQESNANAAEEEAKKKAAFAENEKKKRFELAAEEEKRKAALDEKEAGNNKSVSSSALGATAVAAGTGVTASDSTPKSTAAATSEAPVTNKTVPASSVPVAKSKTPARKLNSTASKETSAASSVEGKSKRSSFFGSLFKKKSKDGKSTSPERQDKKRKSSGALGAAESTAVGAGVVASAGAVGASSGATKAASSAPGGPTATSNDATVVPVSNTTDATTDATTTTEPTDVVGSTDAVKDEIPKQSTDAALPTEERAAAVPEPSTHAEPVSAQKTTELAENPSIVQKSTPATTGELSKETPSGAQIEDGHKFGGSDIENVTGSEFQTSVVRNGLDPILAVKASDPNISLEEISLEQAKHEKDVLAVVAGHDSTLEEVKKSQLYAAQKQAESQAPQSQGSDTLFDQSRGPDTAPTTAGYTEKSRGEISESEAAGIAAATGAAGAGYALGQHVSEQKNSSDEVEGSGVPLASEVEPEHGAAIEPVPTKKDKVGEAANQTAPLAATMQVPQTGLEKNAETHKTPFNQSKDVEPASTSIAKDQPKSTSSTAPLAGVASGSNYDKSAGSQTNAPLNKGEYVEPIPVAIPEEQNFKASEDISAPKPNDIVEQSKPAEPAEPTESSSKSDKAFGAAVGAATAGSLGAAAISNDESREKKIPKSAQPLADSSAPKVVKASEPHNLPPVSREEPSATTETSLDPSSSHQAQDLSTTDDYNTSREATPEPAAILGGATTSSAATPSPSSKGKNAKKNKKKREAKKKKKHTAHAGELESSPEPEFAPSRSIDATTASPPAATPAKKDDSILGSVATIGGGVAGALAGAATTVGLSSEDKKEDTKDISKSSENSASLPTGDYKEPEPVAIPADQKFKVQPGVSKETHKPALGTASSTSKSVHSESLYKEPKPVEIPTDQKFSVAPNVSKSTNAVSTTEDEAPASAETDASKSPGFVETAAIAATGAAITGAAVFEATKEKVVNAVGGDSEQNDFKSTTGVTSKDSEAAENLNEHKDAASEEADAGYYSLDPKKASKRFSQNDTDEKSATVGEEPSKAVDDEKKDGLLGAASSGMSSGIAGKDTEGTKDVKDSKSTFSTTAADSTAKAPSTAKTTKSAPVPTTPKKAPAPVEKPKSGKKFGFKKFWKSDKKDSKKDVTQDVKPVAATATPIKNNNKAAAPSSKPKSVAKADESAKVAKDSKPAKDSSLKEAEISEINPSKATKATTGVVTGDKADDSAKSVASGPTTRDVNTPLQEAEVSEIDPHKATKATTGIVAGDEAENVENSAIAEPTFKDGKDAPLQEAEVSDINPSKAMNATTGVVAGTLAATAGTAVAVALPKEESKEASSSTPVTGAADSSDVKSDQAKQSKDLIKDDNDSVYSYREVYVYEEVTDNEEEEENNDGLVTKVAKAVDNFATTII